MSQANAGTVGFTTSSGRPVSFKSAKAAPAPSEAATVGGSGVDPVAKLGRIIQKARAALVGRDDLLWDIALGLVSGKNVLMIGPPGTAKTYAVDLVARSFCSENDLFSILLTRFTKPQEVFGPVDLASFKSGELRVNTDGYLPAARVGVIDEIFKASSAILNSMLGIANERRFRNGSSWVQCPTRMLVGMSNEFPEDPSLLAAFFDRFPIKRLVSYLPPKDFESMLKVASSGDKPGDVEPLTADDFAEIDRRVAAVTVSDEILLSLSELRSKMKAKNVVVSDRRWVQAVSVMKAAAVLGRRSEVESRDFKHLGSVLWNTESEIAVVRDLLVDFVSPIERECSDIISEARAERMKIINAATKNGSLSAADVPAAADAAAKSIARFRGIAAKIDALEQNSKSLSPKDREQIALARATVTSLEAAIKAVGSGKEGIDRLVASE